MTKSADKGQAKIPAALKAQRPPEAMWLWLPRYRNWQRNKKAVSSGDWLAFDVGLVLDAKKRAVWSKAGPEGLAALLGLVALVGSDAEGCRCGLTWGDDRLLTARVPEIGVVGVDWMIEAGWAVYLTDEQAQIVRTGGGVADLTQGDDETAKGMFDGIKAALVSIWGEPKQSGKSEAVYWKVGKGRQMRLAMHNRRASTDTVCNVIVSSNAKQAAASDVAVSLDGQAEPEAIVSSIMDKVAWKRPADRANESSSQIGPGAIAKADSAIGPATGSSAEKGRLGAAKGDSANASHIQYRTEQNSTDTDTEEDKTQSGTPSARALSSGSRAGPLVDSEKTGTGQDRTAPHKTPPDGTGAGQGDDRPRATNAPDGAEPANPNEPEAGARGPATAATGHTRSNELEGGRVPKPSGQRGRTRSRGDTPTSLADTRKLVHIDTEAKAFGERIFGIIWPGRSTDSDDAQSEIASFGEVWIKEGKAKVPSSMWETLRGKAYEKAADVHKNIRGCDSPGAVFLTLFRKSIGNATRRGRMGADD